MRLLARRLLLLVLLAIPGASFAAQAPQTPAAPPPPLRVFLDCHECDTEYLRQNLLFVDYMRDRMDADLHVLVTTQSTGGGGTSWKLEYLGLGRFQAVNRTVTFTTEQTATFDDQRKEFARVFRLGLAGYAAETSVARDLDVTFKPPPAAKAPLRDPWRKWVFRLSGNANASGEEASSFWSYRTSFSANRITEGWKASISGNTNVNVSRFTLSDGHEVHSRSSSWNLSGSLVNSLGPKLSTGSTFSAGHSSFSNQDRSVGIRPGIEYDFFPYAEWERRRLTVSYFLGPTAYRYAELTIYDKTEETILRQSVNTSLSLRQPWGSMGVSSGFSQDVQHTDRYNASVFGNADVRLFKGFSFNVFADYSKIRDRISLPKEGASEEEILLRLRQLATGYSYSFGFGFSYSFGSIFNNVVNPRFNSGFDF